jgi:hypothetical protein
MKLRRKCMSGLWKVEIWFKIWKDGKPFNASKVAHYILFKVVVAKVWKAERYFSSYFQQWRLQSYYSWFSLNVLCGLVVRVPGYTREMYCVSCEVQTEFIYVM